MHSAHTKLWRLFEKSIHKNELNLEKMETHLWNFPVLLDFLKIHPEVTSLNLNKKHIGDEGAIALAANHTLKTLKLNNNHIYETGAIALAANTTFRRIDLSNNHIGGKGVLAFADNTTLEILNIEYNQINHEEEALIALTQNKTMIVKLKEVCGKPDCNHDTFGEYWEDNGKYHNTKIYKSIIHYNASQNRVRHTKEKIDLLVILTLLQAYRDKNHFMHILSLDIILKIISYIANDHLFPNETLKFAKNNITLPYTRSRELLELLLKNACTLIELKEAININLKIYDQFKKLLKNSEAHHVLNLLKLAVRVNEKGKPNTQLSIVFHADIKDSYYLFSYNIANKIKLEIQERENINSPNQIYFDSPCMIL